MRTDWSAIMERYERNKSILDKMDECPLPKDEISKRIAELKEKVNG